MKLLLFFLSLLGYSTVNAQNVGIGTKNPANKLHVAGGVRIDSLSGAAKGGIVLHDSAGDLGSLKLTGRKSDVLHGDGSFAPFASTALTDAWLLGGNAGLDTLHFLGTTDAEPLRFRLNNISVGKLDDANGNIIWGLEAKPIVGGGEDNVVIGRNAMHGDQSGALNVAIGLRALETEGGHQNIAIGSDAMRVGGGMQNTVVGSGASSYVSGFLNTVVGGSALQGFPSPDPLQSGYNAVFGYSALRSASQSHYNVAMGMQSIENAVYAQLNTAVGYQSMLNADSVFGQTAVGAGTLANISSGLQATATGYLALHNNTTGSYNSAFGALAAFHNVSGNHNSAFGANALYQNVHGHSNTAVGASSIASNETGSFNTAAGAASLHLNISGSYNVATGYRALENNSDGSHNTAHGAHALGKNKASFNTALGSNALAANTVGVSNAAFGYQSLAANISGLSNTANGARSLAGNTTGTNNTAVGNGALITNTTGSLNTAIGMLADVTSPAFSNATAIGYNAKVNASNKVRIGNASVTVIEGQVPFTTPSDRRFKFDVKEDVSGLDFIMKLRPVSYRFDVAKFDGMGDVHTASLTEPYYKKASEMRRTGFIAQEVEAAASEAGYNFSGIVRPDAHDGHYGLSYEAFVMPLVKAVQEQQKMIESLQKRIEELESKQTSHNATR